MTTESAAHKELLQLNQRLLDCIMVGDWETYTTLCDPTISAFEAEACGELVEGLDFHGFYFDPGGVKGPHNTTMTRPHVPHVGRGRGRGLPMSASCNAWTSRASRSPAAARKPASGSGRTAPGGTCIFIDPTAGEGAHVGRLFNVLSFRMQEGGTT